MNIIFTIPGEPAGKGRPRFSRVGGVVRTHTPAKTKSYEQLVQSCFLKAAKGAAFDKNEMIFVRILACFGIPKSATKKRRAMMLQGEILPTKRPDFDNIGKIICDALNGIAYHDDAQIVAAQVVKKYTERPCVVVLLQNVTSTAAKDILSIFPKRGLDDEI